MTDDELCRGIADALVRNTAFRTLLREVALNVVAATLYESKRDGARMIVHDLWDIGVGLEMRPDGKINVADREHRMTSMHWQRLKVYREGVIDILETSDRVNAALSNGHQQANGRK